MTVERPTFHEAWYRVARLRPRLPGSIEIYRQHFRGQMWYVLENPTNNQFSRISVEAYQFIALLDGRRTASEAWKICNDKLGDRAPTQGEVIQLLGQLYTSNLILAEMAPDTLNLFNRYRRRIKRQVQGYLSNLLFIRIPLIDPDHFLNRWVGLFGKIFSIPGFLIWLAVLGAGLYFIIGNIAELFRQSSFVLAGDNLILLYLTFVVIKVFHEFSHSFACKKFGQLSGNGGQVHVMGVMFLVFAPVPYMDASSAWAFRKKRHRLVVGCAGLMTELFFAAIAAMVWANTSPGVVQSIAYNVIFVASVSAVIFNGNPLLRFDAYYVLADLLEIPNLSQRAKEYLYYLVKRWGWGVKQAHNPANLRGERIWFVFYGIASTLYRIYIYVRILLFLNNRLPEELFIVVPILAFFSLIAWVLVPLGKFLRFLTTGVELARTRMRAAVSTIVVLGLISGCLGALPVPDHCRVEGIVEPARIAVVYAESDGFVVDFLPSNIMVAPEGPPLIKAFNRALEAEKESLLAERRGLEIRQQQEQERMNEEMQLILKEQIKALDEKIARVEYELSSLNLQPSISGTWISPNIEQMEGVYLRRGQEIGCIAGLEEMIIRATAGQNVAAPLIENPYKQLEIRVKGRPEPTLVGEIVEIYPAGQNLLPSETLSTVLGGSMAAQSQGPLGVRAAQNFFEIRIRLNSPGASQLQSGQRVISRIRLPSKPLALQWWQSLRQLFQRRFHI